MPVNKERLRLGIAALRSDEFEQYQGALRSEDNSKHCCLGVLTEVAIRNGCKPDPESTYTSLWDMNDELLANPVVEWYGFQELEWNPTLLIEDDPDDPDGQPLITATLANDERGWNFEQIADAFEKRHIPEDVK